MKKIERRFLQLVEMTELLNDQQKKVFSILFKQKITRHIFIGKRSIARIAGKIDCKVL